jgi:hypothetical protein
VFDTIKAEAQVIGYGGGVATANTGFVTVGVSSNSVTCWSLNRSSTNAFSSELTGARGQLGRTLDEDKALSTQKSR